MIIIDKLGQNISKIWQNNLKSPNAPMFRTIARPPDRAARIHNTFSASNMILNTPQGTQEVNKMVSEDFRNKLGPETNNF